MAMTLAEFKDQNDAEEAALNAENAKSETKGEPSPQADEPDTDTEAALEETTEKPEDVETDGDEVAEPEDWMKADDTEPEKEFTSRDIKAAKTNLKAKLDKRHNSETDELKARIAELEKGQAQPVIAGSKLSRPKRSDYFDSDDPDAAYDKAVLDYTLETVRAEQAATTATTQTQYQQEERVKNISKAADAHYERAVELAKKSNISAKKYHEADLAIRTMVEDLYPGNGDAVVDELISLIGEGSEKTMYSVGVNQTKLNELRSKLQSNQTGHTAIAYLASLNAKISANVPRKTNAPAPPDEIKGDKKYGSTQAALMKKHEKALSSGDIQKAINIKRDAKKGGVDTSEW